MSLDRTIKEGYYVRLPKGLYTDVKKLSAALYSPARDSNVWLEIVSTLNRTRDVYVYNTCNGYCYDVYEPLKFKEMIQYTLGGL